MDILSTNVPVSWCDINTAVETQKLKFEFISIWKDTETLVAKP